MAQGTRIHWGQDVMRITSGIMVLSALGTVTVANKYNTGAY